MAKAASVEIVTVDLDKWCDTCHKLLPQREFQETLDGESYATCNKCRGITINHDILSVAKRLALKARDDRIDSPHVSEINAGMFEKWGSIDTFCSAWYDQIQLLIATKPGSKLLMDQFSNQVRLAKLATEHRESAPDLDKMTDEELGEQLMGVVAKLAGEELNAE